MIRLSQADDGAAERPDVAAFCERFEYDELREWFGRPFDPEYFSVEKTNRFLAKLPWPNVSPAALGRVLDAKNKSAP